MSKNATSSDDEKRNEHVPEGSIPIFSAMQGKIVSTAFLSGLAAAATVLLEVESMKMVFPIKAAVAAIVTILVAAGEIVEENRPLGYFTPVDPASPEGENVTLIGESSESEDEY